MVSLARWLLAPAMVLALAAPAWAIECSTRHFYNETSNVTVYVELWSGAECSMPNGPNTSQCTIPPHQTAELHLPTHSSKIEIHDSSNWRRYDLETLSFSCKIGHPDDTGPFAINDPVDGDIRRYQTR